MVAANWKGTTAQIQANQVSSLSLVVPSLTILQTQKGKRAANTLWRICSRSSSGHLSGGIQSGQQPYVALHFK